jgi:uncharacterized protein (TIGR03084 family)
VSGHDDRVGDAQGPGLLEDLADEQEALDAVVAGLDDAAWETPTPSPGWRVRDQIGHLAHYDEQGRRAAADPDGFAADLAEALTDMAAFAAAAEALGRELTGAALLSAWRQRRTALLDALAAVPDGARLPWYGPPMSVRSFATARLMETWAHGQDVVDALGAAVRRQPTDRLRHVCHIGFGTFGWSWRVRGEEPPDADVRVELVLPSGTPWEAGPEGAANVVRGTAEDFCLVVTQRRHVSRTALSVQGDVAEAWMARAQCFAGGPTLPPSPE